MNARARLRDRLAAPFRTRAALGLVQAATPVSVFVPLGFMLGPHGLGILSPDALAHLDPVISIGIATLGVLIGVALVREARGAGAILLAASAEAGVTLLAVALASLVLVVQWKLPIDAPVAAALMLGICASVSSVGPDEPEFAPDRRLAARVADLDDVAPIVLGAVAVPALWASAGRVVAHGLAGVLSALAIAAAGWLLFERARDRAERGVFVLGALALLGGSAAYLAASPLMAGLIAGMFWTVAPGRADAVISEDLRKFQHPLVIVLLVVAGAILAPTPVALWLVVPFVLFRTSGKVIGSRLASRLAPALPRAELGPSLIWPGVVGVAFALNFHQVAPPAAGSAVLAAAAIGAVVSELLALLVTPVPSRA